MEPLTHLTPDTLETYFRAGQPVIVRMASAPDSQLRIDPGAQRMELWVAEVGPEPDVTSLARLSVNTEELDSGTWLVLAVDAEGAHFEAYSLLAAAVDELRRGRPLAAATTRAIDTYRELLERRGRLSQEKTVGLLGELVVLEHLFAAIGSAAAMDAWLGPQSEEHDFVLPDFDAEVKTTLSERRSHLIGSETQLQPSPGRPLWLLSLQLTRAGAAVESFGLPDVIHRIRQGLATGSHDFQAYLGSRGWRDADAELYMERYLWRSRPNAYHVDERFPAVTRPRLDSVIPRPDLVGHVSYRVDVTSLTSGLPPRPLAGFVTGEQA